MAAASQLARRAGPAIYITLAFHRSPLTPRCLGPRPGGPRRSSSHSGTATACEGPARPGKPRAWEGQVSSLIGAPPYQPLMEGGGGHGLGSSKERGRAGVLGLSSPRGSPRATSRAARDSQQLLPQRADGAAENWGWHQWAAKPQHKGCLCPTLPRTHSMPTVPSPHAPPAHSQPKSQSDMFLLGPSFLARFQWAVWLQSPLSIFPIPPGCSARLDPAQSDTCTRSPVQGGGHKEQGGVSGFTS